MISKLANFMKDPKAYYVRVFGPSAALKFHNVEGVAEYDFELPRINRRKGTTCLIRAKNEEDKLWRCLRSVYEAFDEIVIVNNMSDDGTGLVAEEYKRGHDPDGKIHLYNYDFELSKIGPENRETDEDALGSFVYYSNWCLSKCSYSYIFKWDADMILDAHSAVPLRKRLESLSSYWPTYWHVPIQTVYIIDETKVFKYAGEVNSEAMIFPNRSDITFRKSGFYEMLTPRTAVKHCTLCGISIYETKDIRRNEFSHWSTTNFPSERKKREWKHFHELREGRIPEGRGKLLTSEEMRSAHFL